MIEINTRALTGMVLIGCLLIVLCGMMLSAGCITAAKNTYRNVMATPTPTPSPTPTPAPAPTPIPTPTPIVTASINQTMDEYGGLEEGEWVNWHRENVSGLKDMTAHATVYGHKFLNIYNWWSVSWGQYFVEIPDSGKKFLFVYVNLWMDDESDPRFWGMDEDHFYVQIGQDNLTTHDETYQKEIRIKELEETFDLNNVDRIKPYGFLRMYDRNGKEIVMELGYVKAGKSNNWDGFILFQVPKDTKPEDIKILGRFDHLGGDQWWQLR